MKIHEYNEMMAYLTRPRQNFDNGGSADTSPVYNEKTGHIYKKGNRFGISYSKTPPKNQFTAVRPLRSLAELQKVIDEAPLLEIDGKFFEQNPKDLEGRSEYSSKELISRKELDKHREKLKFKSTGKKRIEEINQGNITRRDKIKATQGGEINIIGGKKINRAFSHVYPIIESAKPGTKITTTIDADMNSKLIGYNIIGQSIAEDQEYLLKVKPKGYEKQILINNAKAKRNVMNAIQDLGKDYKGQIGYFQVDPETGVFKPKAGNYKMSFAGLEGENKIYKDMTSKERKAFSKKISEIEKLNVKTPKFKASAIPGLENLIKSVEDMPNDFRAKRYWTLGLKSLGILAAPMVAYDGYTAIRDGLPPDEVIARAALGADKILYKGKEILQLTPEEKEARSLIKQDKLKDLNEDQMMGFGFIEGPEVDSDLSLEEAETKLKEGQDRYADFRKERDAQVAENRKTTFSNLKTVAEDMLNPYADAETTYGFNQGGAVNIKDVIQEYNKGGRVGFAKGPKDPSKRLFVKGLAALSVLPIVGKYFKLAKSPTAVKAVETAMEKVSGMPDWFQPFVNKVLKEGRDVTKTEAIADRQIVKRVDIEDATVDVHYDVATNDVRVEVVGGKTALDEPLQMQYKAPEVLEESGKKTKAQFEASESVPEGRQVGPDDYDIDLGENTTEVLDDLLSETDYLEGYATGKIRTPAEIKKAKERARLRNLAKEKPGEYLDEVMGPYDDTIPDDFYD